MVRPVAGIGHGLGAARYGADALVSKSWGAAVESICSRWIPPPAIRLQPHLQVLQRQLNVAWNSKDYLGRVDARLDLIEKYRAAYRPYCWRCPESMT